MRIDIKAFGLLMAGIVKEYVGPIVATLNERLDDLQKRLEALPVPTDGTDGIDGKDGTSVTLDDVLPVLEARLLEEVAALPKPENGKDGESVTLDDVRPLIEEAVAAIPPPAAGVDGKDGTSVTVDDVLPIIEEKVAEAVAAIPVPENGKDGVDGTSVTLDDVKPLIEEAVAAISKPIDGVDGKDGTSVTVEDVIPLVVEQVDEAAGRLMGTLEETVKELVAAIPVPQNGVDGKDGNHGRDALEIDVLPAINEDKSYPRGTYATHKGGLWRARRNTDGMEGWDCVVRGIESVTVTMGEDLRTFELKHVFSDSEAVEQFVMPVVLYRGVFSEGTKYAAGDAVTWAGSVWIARAAAETIPNGADGLWTLSVKEGRAGRNAGDGAGTPKGQQVKVP